MKIISKFQDYYDSAGLMYGVDTNLFYERKTEDVDYSLLSNSQRNLLNDYIDNLPYHSGWKNNFSLESGVIGFCGKLYPIYQYINNSINYKTYDYFTNFSKFANSHKNLPKSMFKVRDNKTISYSSRWFVTKPEAWAFELAEQKYAGLVAEDIFYNLNTPIFLKWRKKSQNRWVNKSYSASITLSPYLKILDFQHYFEPLAAFQEVSMYVAALANKNENINYTVGDDKTIAESKGHSVKESFRQSAPTKKQKRKLNKERKQ